MGTTISSQSPRLVYHILWASGTGNQVSGIKTANLLRPKQVSSGVTFIFVYRGKSSVSHLLSLLAISHHDLQAECHTGGLEHTSERLLPLRVATVAP